MTADPVADGFRLSQQGREESLAALREAETAPRSAIEAVGRLAVARSLESTREYLPALHRAVPVAQASVDVESLGEKLDEVIAWVETEPPEDGDPEPAWLELAQSVLDERHRLELTCRGIEALRPGMPVLGGEEQARLEALDEQLRAQLWRLTLLNEHRLARLREIAPEHRPFFWWYSRGAQVPAAAVTHVGEVVSLVASFPEAQAEFDALAAADALLGARACVVSPSEPALGAAREPAQDAGEPAEPSRERRRQKPWLALAGLAAGVALLGAGGFVFALSSAHDQAETEKAFLLSEAQRLKEERDAQLKILQSALASKEAMSEAQRLALEQQLEDAMREASASAGAQPVQRPAARPSKKPSLSCVSGDPLCGGL